jgi:carboxypeptidase family protein
MQLGHAVRLVVALAFVVAGPTLVLAQITTGSVFGTVRDAQGAVVPGATAVLVSETRGTRTSPVASNTSGDFSIPNVTADTYTLEITMDGFKTITRTGIPVSGGDRVSVPALTLEVGGRSEVVTITAEAALIQANSGERSAVIDTTLVQNLPINSRNFTAVLNMVPGVSGTNRLGGGGQNNIMMDGISAMDTGNNGQMLQMNMDAIQEVKILTQGYQAEFGRSSGLQITAVTKSGSNQFRGSLYDVERDSDWNANSWVNQRNGDPKPIMKEKDWGYSLGGPVGKPGASNKLFFFYSHEYRPRNNPINNGNPIRLRVPTALERAGDFSQSLDNNGAAIPQLLDPITRQPFPGNRIPSDRLYQTGLAVLNRYPLPNIQQAAATNYN